MPGGPLAPLVDRLAVRGWLDSIFDYRARRLADLLAPGALHSFEGLRGAAAEHCESSGPPSLR